MEQRTEIAERILKRRKQCLVHRYLYYVQSASLVTDQLYDSWERELRLLVEQYPAISKAVEYDEDCPTRKVGSSLLEDYPKEIQMLGDSLLTYNPNNVEWWAKATGPHEEIELPKLSLFD